MHTLSSVPLIVAHARFASDRHAHVLLLLTPDVPVRVERYCVDKFVVGHVICTTRAKSVVFGMDAQSASRGIGHVADSF